MGMNDYTSIAGEEPKDLKVIYSFYPNLNPEINYGKFGVTNYPNITVYEIIRSGDKFNYSVEQLRRFKNSSKDTQMGDIYSHYNDALEVYGEIEVCEIINLPGHIMTNPERNSISSKTIYRMNDGTLKATYFTGDLYYDIDDCKKLAIKGMKKCFEYADETYKNIGEQIKKEKEEWNKVFLEYPHHSI